MKRSLVNSEITLWFFPTEDHKVVEGNFSKRSRHRGIADDEYTALELGLAAPRMTYSGGAVKISTILDRIDDEQLFVPAFQRTGGWLGFHIGA